MDTSKIDQKYKISVVFKNTVNFFKEIVQYIMLNIEILEHLFLKIDKHTIAFENQKFREDF